MSPVEIRYNAIDAKRSLALVAKSFNLLRPPLMCVAEPAWISCERDAFDKRGVGGLAFLHVLMFQSCYDLRCFFKWVKPFSRRELELTVADWVVLFVSVIQPCLKADQLCIAYQPILRRSKNWLGIVLFFNRAHIHDVARSRYLAGANSLAFDASFTKRLAHFVSCYL